MGVPPTTVGFEQSANLDYDDSPWTVEELQMLAWEIADQLDGDERDGDAAR